jgi:hypothetical protein
MNSTIQIAENIVEKLNQTKESSDTKMKAHNRQKPDKECF